MKKAFGYSQMKFNYITDYANDIAERSVQLEMAWSNRDNFKSEIDVQEWMKNQVEALEMSMRELSKHLKPDKDCIKQQQANES
ncbi:MULTISPECIES: hypothetical protein [unclassified Enterococcus]|uniref:hypothetical protein n=1 Tax=unclassified Enterococcus TaxID=2608891 RepID=UPI001907ED65|nr:MULTISPECIES: hypothetical protein [unclassified Enterococcus]MBK0036699.1 hypothetical protein [Enterococcus sp. S52]MBK0069362.1 hypothetical protein [Enterococcus sp. S53]MBK0139955.1 hypothetical protein [Enterococcus sp. S76]MBK0143586.1 hypothetical protein [Enterococcus sp. S77]